MDNLTLGRVLWRSFFLQASWNYRGKQNIGVAAALTPALEKIYGIETPALVKALERSLEPFNTQPYMAGPILGALIKSEELVIEGGFPMERLARLKAALTTAFAAIGDALFWNAILPLAAVIGLFWSARARMEGVVLFLAFYNLLPLFIRIMGFWRGYREGLNVAMVIDRFSLPLVALRMRHFTAGALGLLAAWSLTGGIDDLGISSGYWLAGLAVAPLVIFTARFLKRGVPVEAFVYGAFAVLTTGAYIIN